MPKMDGKRILPMLLLTVLCVTGCGSAAVVSNSSPTVTDGAGVVAGAGAVAGEGSMSGSANADQPVAGSGEKTGGDPSTVGTAAADTAQTTVVSISTETTSVPVPMTATLISAGDVVPHKKFQLSGLTADGANYDFTSVFQDIRDQVTSADMAVIDVESAMVEQPDNYTGYPMFNTSPSFLDALAGCGFDIVNNVNNHALDRRLDGYRTTRTNIEAAGMEAFGYVDEDEIRHHVREVNGIRLATVSYTYSYNGNEAALDATAQAAHLSMLDEPRMKAELEAMEQEADVSVVLLHWGNEYQQTPSQNQRDLAQKLLSWGADVLLGSHPHVVQPSEIVTIDGEAKYIVYSMGNFASNQRRGESGMPNVHKELCEDSMLVHLTFDKDPQSGETVIASVTHVPTWLWMFDENGSRRYRIIPVASKDDAYLDTLPADAADEARASYDRTMPLMTNYP